MTYTPRRSLEMNNVLSGKDPQTGKEWSIQGKQTAHREQYYALVIIGAKRKITDSTYAHMEDAINAGRYLLAKTLAEIGGSVRHAA
jgi:hypothetical protein